MVLYRSNRVCLLSQYLDVDMWIPPELQVFIIFDFSSFVLNKICAAMSICYGIALFGHLLKYF